MIDPIIQIENVSFSYNEALVLENVNLAIQAGDFASIVGPNGGGKTTLLKLMLGLLIPKTGRIRVFGKSPKSARKNIGYMPQYAALDPQFPVRILDVVLMGRLGSGRGFGPFSKQDRKAAQKVLAQVNLEELSLRPFSSLSGGQKQRVLIARALVSEPKILLLDEPTSNLDMQVEGAFFDLLKNLNEHLTVLLVSHDLAFVSQHVKNVVCVKKEVHMHPTDEISQEAILNMYGDMKIVRHDRTLVKGEDKCWNS